MLMLRVGGVPEHYNLPWHLLKESGTLEDLGVDLEWRDYYGGTGQMANHLRTGELDIAVLLTEGMISDILKGSDARILKVFVKSSLEWGVHISESEHTKLTNIEDPITFAISKEGSGSHLMALLYAQQNGIPVSNLKFEEVGSVDGAMEAFKNQTVDAFLWEKFTTEPYCEANNLKRVDSIHTPWPCFVVAARPKYYEKYHQQIEQVLEGVFTQATNLKENPSAIKLITDRYNLSSESAEKWFEKVAWGQGENLSDQEIENVIDNLKESTDLLDDFSKTEMEFVLNGQVTP